MTGKTYARDGNTRNLSDFDSKLAVLDNISEAGEISLFDLRPLRKMIFLGRLRSVPERLKTIIYAYDAILVLPELTHALEKFD